MQATRLLIGVIVSLVVVLATGLALVSADEPEWPETITRVLQPGDNFVGWTTSEVPIDELFATIPRLEVIHVWNARLGQWRIASPAVPGSFNSIRVVEPRVGLRLRLSGDDDFVWTREVTPVRGTVTLTAGYNLVAWLGEDDVPISDATSGVGSALISVRLANGEDRNLVRGDALWVEVSRNVNWLQPTDLLPKLEFPGGVTETLRDQIRDELLDIIDHYTQEFGVQADASAYEILAARNVEGLISYYGASSQAAEATRDLWDEAAGWWNGTTIVIKQRYFGCATCRKYVLSHEYFHALQNHLSGRREGIPGVTWTTEGMATWAETNHEYADGLHLSFESSRRRARMSAASGPLLQQVEQRIGTWPYSLGMLATDRLVERAGEDSPLEFYRLLAPQAKGIMGRWRSHLGWQGAINVAFGIAVGDFYEEFNRWQNSLPGRKPWDDAGEGDRILRGKLTRANGKPIADARVIAGLGGDDLVTHDYRESVTRSEADGTWELPVSSNRRYRLRVELAESQHSHLRCTVYWQKRGATWDYLEAEVISVESSDPDDVEFVLPDDWCARRISGRIVDASGNGIEGLQVVAGSKLTPHERNAPRVLSQLDGSYEFVVPRAGEYRVTVRTEELVMATGCEIHYSKSGATSSRKRASDVNVEHGDASGLNIELREDMCVWKVSGVLLDSAGEAITEAAVRLQTDETIVSFRTDRSGAFELTVPEPGQWFISISWNRCHLYHAHGTTVTDWRQRSLLQFGGTDVSWLPIRVAPGHCDTPVAGRVLYADGTPAHGLQMFVGSALFLTEKDGTFDGNVAEPGEQNVTLWTKEGCQLFRTAEGWSGVSGGDGAAIDVPLGGLTGIVLTLPEKPSTLCN